MRRVRDNGCLSPALKRLKAHSAGQSAAVCTLHGAELQKRVFGHRASERPAAGRRRELWSYGTRGEGDQPPLLVPVYPEGWRISDREINSGLRFDVNCPDFALDRHDDQMQSSLER